MKRILLLPLICAACATTPKPSLDVQTQTVFVDRPVPCVAAADVPKLPDALPARPADARAALDLALAKLVEWAGYGEKAEPLLKGCAKP